MEILIAITVSLLIGLAAGLALRKKPAPEDHSGCVAAQAEAEREHEQRIFDASMRHDLDVQFLLESQTKELETQKAEYEKTAFLIPEGVGKLVDAAKSLALPFEQDKTGMSGEAKRHQVYARLIKDFPESTRKDIALAIELAMRKI